MENEDLLNKLNMIFDHTKNLKAEIDRIKHENKLMRDIIVVQNEMNTKILTSLGEVRRILNLPDE